MTDYLVSYGGGGWTYGPYSARETSPEAAAAAHWHQCLDAPFPPTFARVSAIIDGRFTPYVRVPTGLDRHTAEGWGPLAPGQTLESL